MAKRLTKRRLWNVYDRTLDWLAVHLLPPPTPTRLKIFNYRVTKLDIAVTVGGVLIALVGALWYNNVGWFFISLGLLAMVWIWLW